MITSKRKIALPTAIPAISPGDKPLSFPGGSEGTSGVHSISRAVN